MRRYILSFLLIWCVPFVVFAGEKARRLLILHTNDTHSQMEPYSGGGAHHGMGGILRRKVLVDSVRATEPAVLLVDAGDFWQGTPYYTYFFGRVEVQMMNILGYDAATLGNHEFDLGIDSLSHRLTDIRSSIVVSNYDLSRTPLSSQVTKHCLKEIAGWKVGFVGVGVNPEGLFLKKNYTGLKFLDPVQSANREARWLKQQGADLVIALSHLGFSPTGKYSNDDRQLARSSEDIDIIIGGHSHTELRALHLEKNRLNRDVYIAQTGHRGVYVGEIEWDGVAAVGQLLPVDNRYDTRCDTTLKLELDGYRNVLNRNFQAVVGEVVTPMEVGRPQSRLPNLFVDMLKTEFGDECDFALLNIGAVRNGWRAGPITMWDVYAAIPFRSHVVRLWLGGADVLRLFEQISQRGGEAVSREVSLRISKDGTLLSGQLNGEDIDINRVYRVATIDYLAEGNDDLMALCRFRKRIDSTELLRDVILKQLKQITSQGTKIESAVDSRIIIERTK